MSLETLPPLREVLDEAGLLARKSFGQHFLLDLNITRKIARLAGPLEGFTVLEVGPDQTRELRVLVTLPKGEDKTRNVRFRLTDIVTGAIASVDDFFQGPEAQGKEKDHGGDD